MPSSPGSWPTARCMVSTGMAERSGAGGDAVYQHTGDVFRIGTHLGRIIQVQFHLHAGGRHRRWLLLRERSGGGVGGLDVGEEPAVHAERLVAGRDSVPQPGSRAEPVVRGSSITTPRAFFMLVFPASSTRMRAGVTATIR
jgi:hypothetical protein